MRSILKLAPALFLLMWSSGAIFVKLGLQDASVWVFLAVRAIGSALLLGLVAIAFLNRRGSNLLVMVPSQAPKILAVGLVIQVAYQAFFFLALDHNLSPGVLSIILGLQPILSPVIAREKPGPIGYVLLLTGFAGLVIAVAGARDLNSISTLGVAFGVLAAGSISTGAVLQTTLSAHPITSAFYQNLASAALFFVLVVATDWRMNLSGTFVVSAVWMIVVVSTLSVLLLYYMLQHEAVNNVAVLFYLVPILTIAWDYCVFGTRISGATLLGALIVVLSVKLYRRRRVWPIWRAGSSTQN